MTTLRTALILLLVGMPALGHRLDEYLQAALLSVEKDRIHTELHLTPGVAVLPVVLGSIDSDANEIISDAEQRAYAERVLHDLSLSIDGDRLRLRLVSMRFPKVDEMKQGLGEIQLAFDADVPRGGPDRRLVFENHHQTAIATYLVNSLVPQDPDIRITAQSRDYLQSCYELNYQQAGGRPGTKFFDWLSGGAWLGMFALLLSGRFAFLWRRRANLQQSNS